MSRRSVLLVAAALAAAAGLLALDSALMPQPNASESPRLRPGRMIARIWHGRTLTAKADEYERYLEVTGVAKILKTQGNHGVEVLRKTGGPQTDFVVISYWESVDAIKKFAGANYEKAVIMGRDREFLLEVEPSVLHYEVVRAGGR
jgi:heme-degrading monooxygenase HmoA